MIFEKKYRTLFPLLGVWIIFIVSRVFYDQAGIRFTGDTYLGYWQFIDPVLLRTDLWRSVFYLHSQPPLINLLTGIVLQIFPADSTEIFHILYFIAGMMLGTSIYFLGVSLHFPNWLSAMAAAWFIVSPGTVLYEHWLMYAYPLTMMLTLAGICLYQFIVTKKIFWGLLFFALLSAISLTWSLFHLIWMLGFGAILLIVFPERKKIVFAALIPMLLVTAWYAKNFLIVGEFSASSWAGMNLSKVATFRISEKERTGMVKAGELSKFALILPFRNPSAYLKLLPDTPLTGIPVLDEPDTSLGGRNHHHLVYVEASKYYLRDALYIIRVRPDSYLRSIGQAVYIYFHSPSDFELIGDNRKYIQTFDLWWNRIFYGQWQTDETSVERNSTISGEHIGWGIVIVFLINAAGSVNFLWKKRSQLAAPETMLVFFMAYNIFFVTLVGNLMDIGENNRFRFTVDPFLLILFIFLLRNFIFQRIQNRPQTEIDPAAMKNIFNPIEVQ